jgi:predicted MFS family arabinose efflux permease
MTDSSTRTAALAPFRVRNFRLQWPADLCTAWALEMENLILGWYVLVETGSVVLLTVYGSLLLVGTLVSPLIGMLGDRWGLRNVLAAMRASYALFATIILLLALTKILTPMLVLAIAALSGLIRPTDIGMRSALVGANVPPQHLVAALGISRTTQDTARIGGALLGTGFMAAFGMVPAYLVICAFYLTGVLLTLQVRYQSSSHNSARATPSPWRELKDGLVYVWHTPRLRAAMSVAALVNLTVFPFTSGLMPYIARDIFGLDQQGLGWLVASFGCGALIGSVSMSAFGERIPAARGMLAGAVGWHLCLVGFVFSNSLPVAFALLLGAGFAQSLSMISLSILLLRTSEPRFRGRIMGVRMLAIYTLPIGLLAAGALIPRIGFLITTLMVLALGLLLIIAIALIWRVDLLGRDAVGNAR